MHDPSSGRSPGIEEQLKAEVEAAKAAYENTRRFDDWAATLIRESQSADTDSHYLAQQLIAQRAQATNRLTAALKQFQAFILHGTVPEHLKNGS